MKKYLIALFFTTLFIFPCFANEQTEEEYEEVELNAFGFPDKSFVTLIENQQIASHVAVNEKPDCSDEDLIERVREAAKPYVESSATTIVNKRRNILITKNIDNFSDLSIDDAYGLENRILKARMVELKINNKIDNTNIKICQSNNPILRDKLYILMYDNKNNVKVELLNLAVDNIPTFLLHNN